MLGRNSSDPSLFQMVDIESLVPADHKLRKLDAVLDLSFVPEEVAECYAQGRGRPSVDPELALRMMLLGELYDLSDRELCQEIQMHAGMRWFCRRDFHDPIPDHSTLSRLRNERWAESGLFERLMNEVVRQCSEAGLVSGRHLSVDGTEIRADASMKSLKRRGPQPPPEDPPPGGGAGGGGGEPKPAGEWKGHGETYRNRTHFSTTDPDARLYRKGNAREAGLKYLGHDLIDTKSRVILSREVTLATGTAERDTALEMLDEVLENEEELGLPHRPEILTGDTGYGSGPFVAAVLARGLEPHIPLLADEEMEEVPTWQRRTFDLDQMRARKQKLREAEARNRVRRLMKTRGYQVSRKLRVRVEHNFAEAKNQHGLARARRRGRERVQQQATLAAVVQNLKRLANFMGRQRPGQPQQGAQSPASRLFHSLKADIRAIFGHIRARIGRHSQVDLPLHVVLPELRFPRPLMSRTPMTTRFPPLRPVSTAALPGFQWVSSADCPRLNASRGRSGPRVPGLPTGWLGHENPLSRATVRRVGRLSTVARAIQTIAIRVGAGTHRSTTVGVHTAPIHPLEILKCVDGEADFQPLGDDRNWELGRLAVSLSTSLLITDGQHRWRAICEALSAGTGGRRSGTVIRLRWDPVKKKVVQRIYELADSGMAQTAIANALSGEGQVSPNGTTNWSPSTVGDILRSPIYKGDLVWGVQRHPLLRSQGTSTYKAEPVNRA